MDDEEDELAATREWMKAPHIISEVNTFLVTASDISPAVKSTNTIAKLSFSRPYDPQSKNAEPAQGGSQGELQFDKDGDPILTGIRTPAGGAHFTDDNLFIEFENSTTLDLVGLQIWRGALLLADFIMHNQLLFKDKIVLELGSGTGLSSVVASFYARKVIATDLNEPDILKLIEANKNHNQRFVNAEFQVAALDFTNLNWSTELENFVAETDVILAADVVYHNKITEALVRTLQKCLTTGKPKTVFIALEKRYVFTISDLDTSAPMYENFMDSLNSLFFLSSSPANEPQGDDLPQVAQVKPVALTSDADNSQKSLALRYNLAPVSTDFPQYFCYERTKELVLWKIQPVTTSSIIPPQES